MPRRNRPRGGEAGHKKDANSEISPVNPECWEKKGLARVGFRPAGGRIARKVAFTGAVVAEGIEAEGLSVFHGLSRSFRSFRNDRRGNILVATALSLPVLLGVGGLVIEYGSGLVEEGRNQRVADLSAYAGALAYSETNSEARMRSAAISVAQLNGVPAASVQATLENSPKTTGSKAVHVEIRTQRDLFLSKILNPRTELEIYAAAMTEVGSPSTAGCILALDGTQSGITLSGAAKIEANTCTVSSNNTISVPCGTRIWSVGVNYNSSTAPYQPCNDIKGPGGSQDPVITRQETPDPLADNTAIADAYARIGSEFSRLAMMSGMPAPKSSPGSDINFVSPWQDASTTITQATNLGCTASRNGDRWVFACPAGAKVNIRQLTISNGAKIDFAINGHVSTEYDITNLTTEWIQAGDVRFGPGTYTFRGEITIRGTVSFENGTFNFLKGLINLGGSNVSFGAGTFRFGQNDSGCNGARYSICNTGTTMTFGGPSTFELAAGFYNGGGATLTFGSGTTNSFKIGPSSNGNAIELGGGSKTIMADATGSGNVFQVRGHVNGGGGGSCFIISAAANHDIDGNFIASGAVLMGAGVYTIDGYFVLGQSGGGSATCNGQTFSVRAIDVTLIISGKNVSNSGACNGFVFCIASGYSGVELTAPTTGPLAKVAVVGPQLASRTAGATFSQGGSNARISGAFYFPNGPLIMDGGASAMGSATNPDMCLQLIGSRITLSGGTAVGSECVPATGAAGGGKITLIR